MNLTKYTERISPRNDKHHFCELFYLVYITAAKAVYRSSSGRVFQPPLVEPDFNEEGVKENNMW